MDKREAFDIVDRYLKYLILNNYHIDAAYLFGSYAKNTFGNDSDIDVAIIFDELHDRFTTQVQLLMLTTQFDTRIEPHPIDKRDFNAKNPFVFEILKHGVELKISKI